MQKDKCDDMKIKAGRAIRGFRRALGLNQREFADLFNESPPKCLKVRQGDISRYENGVINCPADKFLKFRDLVRKSIRALSVRRG